MLFKKNDKIGPYTVTFPHKESTHAETYRVKDPTGRTRFLKLINHARLGRHQVDDNGRVVEAEIARLLDHHNLCRFVDTGRITAGGGQRTYVVTEFVSGETLSQKVIRDDIGVYDIKQIAKAVLAALDYLHNLPQPVVHGEVTMQNVMLNLVGGYADLKLVGLGHAQFLDQPSAKPDLDEQNPFYLAPERFSGICQVQTDLYAVGAMIYHLLYGELPWFVDTSRTRGDRVERILQERNRPLALEKKDIFELDDQLLNCMAKALAYDVDDRFQTAKEFIRALDGEIKVDRQDTRRKVRHDEPRPKEAKGELNLSRKAEGPGFAAIAGMEELKQQMREEVIEPLHHPEEYERYGVTIPNGMLLYGPPGCGKTFFAKHLAEEVGFNFMQVTPATLKSRYINATQENIAKMFQEAEANAPTLIFIDEINDLLKDRARAEDKGMSGTDEFLAQMDRTGEKGIFIVGATNRPDILDPAVLRAGRLEKKYYIGVPDEAAREALFRLYLQKRPYDFGLDYARLARMTRNYVSDDIRLIVNNASRAAMKARSKITMDILCDAINEVKPSLSDKELEKYERIRAAMNGETPPRAARPKIGF